MIIRINHLVYHIRQSYIPGPGLVAAGWFSLLPQNTKGLGKPISPEELHRPQQPLDTAFVVF
jgi:hypothetical protein